MLRHQLKRLARREEFGRHCFETQAGIRVCQKMMTSCECWFKVDEETKLTYLAMMVNNL